MLSQPLALFRNKGDGSFEDVTLELLGKIKIGGLGLSLGNKVWVSVEGRLLAYRDYSGNSGISHSQGCAPLHIGLGRHTKVDVKVQWLNGKVVTLENISVDRVLAITDEV